MLTQQERRRLRALHLVEQAEAARRHAALRVLKSELDLERKNPRLLGSALAILAQAADTLEPREQDLVTLAAQWRDAYR